MLTVFAKLWGLPPNNFRLPCAKGAPRSGEGLYYGKINFTRAIHELHCATHNFTFAVRQKLHLYLTWERLIKQSGLCFCTNRFCWFYITKYTRYNRLLYIFRSLIHSSVLSQHFRILWYWHRKYRVWGLAQREISCHLYRSHPSILLVSAPFHARV